MSLSIPDVLHLSSPAPRRPRSSACVRSRRVRAAVVAATALVLVTTAPGAAADPSSAPAAPGVSPPSGTEPDVCGLLDETVAAQLEQYDIPGAAVSWVAGGRVRCTQGHGVADADTGRPVDGTRTSFFLASAAKTITATAVMQLVDRGEVDLHVDVDEYLTSLEVDDTYPGEPVTLHHLLTHTSGFDTPLIGVSESSPDAVVALPDWLAAHQPRRVRPPGEITAYDNYGVALAGQVVADVSGEPFEQYVHRHVLDPLGMRSTTFAQPAAPSLTSALATGHRVEGGRQRATGAQYGAMSPTGAGTLTTAADMGRFLVFQLGGAGDAGRAVLSSEALRATQQRRFGLDPRLPGLGYVWEEGEQLGVRVLRKTGTVPGSHSSLALFPDAASGLFVVYNGEGAHGGARRAAQELTGRVVEVVAARAAPALVPVAEPQDLAELEGAYRTSRTAGRDLSRVQALFSGVEVQTAGADSLTISGLPHPDPSRTSRTYVAVGHDLFREREGDDRVAFLRAPSGRVVGLADAARPSETFQRLAPWQAPGAHRLVLAAGLVLLALDVLCWASTRPVRRLVRALPGRARARPTAGRAVGTGQVRWLSRLTSASVVACATSLVALFESTGAEERLLTASTPLLTVVPLLWTTAALAAGACAVLLCRRRAAAGSRWARLHSAAVVAVATAWLGTAGLYGLLPQTP